MNRAEKIEILAPAGDFESLASALKAGADSVYFGVGKLNMRSRAAANFAVSDLPKIVKFCRKFGANPYLALNSVIYDEELAEVEKICNAAAKAGVAGIIATDVAVMELARSAGIPVHISVQANVSNYEAVKFFAKFADTIILARELTLAQIGRIVEKIREEKLRGPSGELVRIEIFAHGALCVSISGKCYMSIAKYNSSANRGDCYQTCRRKYRVIDEETGYEMTVDNQYVMSPSDLCTIRIIDKILDTGVKVLKIEGRGRPPEYVGTVTTAYKNAVELWRRGKFSAKKAEKLEKELEKVFNRGFWHGGYYLGDTAGVWSGISGSAATLKKTALGIIVNYYNKIKIAELELQAGDLKKGDKLLVTGTKTGCLIFDVGELQVEGKKRDTAHKGETVTFVSENKIRRNDKVYTYS